MHRNLIARRLAAVTAIFAVGGGSFFRQGNSPIDTGAACATSKVTPVFNIAACLDVRAADASAERPDRCPRPVVGPATPVSATRTGARRLHAGCVAAGNLAAWDGTDVTSLFAQHCLLTV